MPRKRRREESGLIHHACLHSVDDELMLRTREDRVGFTLMLAATVVRYRWLCLSYCQMGTHVHLLVETPEPNFGDGIRWLAGRYGAAFNKQHRRRSHVFGGRYHDEPVETEAHFLNAVGYIAVNPCKAGLCADPAEWPWGSHARVTDGTAGAWLAHQRLLDRLEAIAGADVYDRLIEARMDGLIDTPREKGPDPSPSRRGLWTEMRSLIDTPREKGPDPSLPAHPGGA